MFAVENYPSNGFACPISVLSTEEAEGFAEHFMELKQTQPDIVDQALGPTVISFFPSLCEIAQRAAVLDAVEHIIGPNILLWSAGFFIKYPQTRSLFPGIRTAPIGDWNLQILSLLGLHLPPVTSKTAACRSYQAATSGGNFSIKIPLLITTC